MAESTQSKAVTLALMSTRRQKRGRRGPARRPTRDETSAGGLVVDLTSMRAVIIGRRNTRGRLLWSLPKGHLEEGETAEVAALREVQEETGLIGEIAGELGTIDFWFQQERIMIHKTVHHFLIIVQEGELVGQEGEVDEIAWVGMDQIAKRLTHDDEKRLIVVAKKLLAELT